MGSVNPSYGGNRECGTGSRGERRDSLAAQRSVDRLEIPVKRDDGVAGIVHSPGIPASNAEVPDTAAVSSNRAAQAALSESCAASARPRIQRGGSCSEAVGWRALESSRAGAVRSEVADSWSASRASKASKRARFVRSPLHDDGMQQSARRGRDATDRRQPACMGEAGKAKQRAEKEHFGSRTSSGRNARGSPASGARLEIRAK